MNIAFFGTSDRSVPILEGLNNSNFDLLLCVTKNDVKFGRSGKLKQTEVKKWANINGVQVVTISHLNTEKTAYLKTLLKKMAVDVCVVADFGFMLPEDLLNFPKYKFINIHFSSLPYYRGASPVQFSILNREKETGISYLVITKGMDEGPIIYQTRYKLNGTETSENLYKTLFEISANDLPKILNDYVKGKLKPKEQDHSKATYCYSPSHPKSTHIYREDAKINWGESAEKIDAQIRAFNFWPVAWTTLRELEKHLGLNPNKKMDLVLKIYKGRVVDDKYSILEIQPENKKVLDWNSFKNGYLVSASAD